MVDDPECDASTVITKPEVFTSLKICVPLSCFQRIRLSMTLNVRLASRQATLHFLKAVLCCRQRVELILQLRTSRCARVGAVRQRFSRLGEHRYSAYDRAT